MSEDSWLEMAYEDRFTIDHEDELSGDYEICDRCECEIYNCMCED
jgi:hypothetical protein